MSLVVAGVATALAVLVVSGGGARRRLAPEGPARPQRQGRLRRRRLAARRRREVVPLLFALAAELRAGQPPDAALRAAAGSSDVLRQAVDAAAAQVRRGVDVEVALGSVALLDGADRLRPAAVAWGVATGAGGSAATLLDNIASAYDAEDAGDEQLAALTAGPRTTMLLLAALPLAGLLLGSAMGTHPLQLLLHTRAGAVLIVTAVTLDTAGVMWMRRIIRVAGVP